MTRRKSTRADAAAMTNSGRASASGPATPFVPPYPPSWVDRLTAAVDRLPGPAWLAYLGLAVLVSALQLAIQSSTGDYRPGSLQWFHVWAFGYFAYVLAMIHYLDRSAEAAIRTFRPVLATIRGRRRARVCT